MAQKDSYSKSYPSASRSDSVNSVTIKITVKSMDATYKGNARSFMKEGSDKIYGTLHSNIPNSWIEYEDVYNNNPNTGYPWEWNEVKNLQIGADLGSKYNGGFYYGVTFTKVELIVDWVNYGLETFRPIGTGTYQTIPNQFPDSGSHWDKVDESVSDGDTTYVYSTHTAPSGSKHAFLGGMTGISGYYG